MERERGEMEREKVRALVNAPASSTRAQGVGLCVGRAATAAVAGRGRHAAGTRMAKRMAKRMPVVHPCISAYSAEFSRGFLHVDACESAVVVQVGACDSVVHPLSVRLP